jgi:hypothetical protein
MLNNLKKKAVLHHFDINVGDFKLLFWKNWSCGISPTETRCPSAYPELQPDPKTPASTCLATVRLRCHDWLLRHWVPHCRLYITRRSRDYSPPAATRILPAAMARVKDGAIASTLALVQIGSPPMSFAHTMWGRGSMFQHMQTQPFFCLGTFLSSRYLYKTHSS